MTLNEERSDEHATLLARSARGDQAALRELFAAFRPRLWRYLQSQLGEYPELIEEVLQDVFGAAWRSAADFRGEARVATWLYRLAHNHAANTRRSSQRRGSVVGASYMEDTEKCAERPAYVAASHDDEVAARLDQRLALQHIPEKQREALELAFVQGFSCDEAGRIVGAPTGTIKSRLIHARHALAALLEETTRLESASNG